MARKSKASIDSRCLGNHRSITSEKRILRSRKARSKVVLTSNPPNKNRRKRYSALDSFKVERKGTNGKWRLQPALKQDGIHSQQWALSIIPQPSSPLLSLPLELRRKIYAYALHCPYYGNPTLVMPKKKRNCYVDKAQAEGPEELSAVTIYNTLSILNKQTYLDVVGSSLFYQVVTLSFRSLYLLETFLSNINPIHYNSIRSLKLCFSITRKQHSFPLSVFRTISTLANLKHLQLHILVDRELCDYDSAWKCRGGFRYEVKKEILRKWAGAKWEMLTGMPSLESFKLCLSAEQYSGGLIPMNDQMKPAVGMVEGLKEIRRLVGWGSVASTTS